MRWSTWVWPALPLVVGSILVAVAQLQAGDAATYTAAVACSDTSSPNCYQTSPGQIRAVKEAMTSSGVQDKVTIDTRGTTIDVSLTPSGAQVTKVKVGADVSVKWYVSNVVAVIIDGDSIPSTASPLSSLNGLGYVGWMLVWLGAAFALVLLVTRRLVKAEAVLRRSLAVEPQIVSAGSQALLPYGAVGWTIKPKMGQVLLLPVAAGIVALVSITPLLNPQRRATALVIDGLLVAGVILRWALTLRNMRVLADSSSIAKVDWLGRVQRWQLSEGLQGLRYSVKLLYTNSMRISFFRPDGSELFAVSDLYWDLIDVSALCLAIGVPLSGSYDSVRLLISRRQALVYFVGSLVLGTAAGAYFFPGT